jgi:four helix bundle protein
MNEREFKERTRQFGLRVIRLVASLRKGAAEDVLGRQILRSATSVGANYRAACRARSKADMIAKLSIVEEEADESIYWLELIIEAGMVSQKLVKDLLEEGNSLLAITVASIKTLRSASNPKSKT